MNHNVWRAILCLSVVLFNTRCSEMDDEYTATLIIGAGILPLADFVRQVGGDQVKVFTIVPPGSNPHTFELTPGLMKKLSDSDLIVLNGVGLEFWIEDVKENIPNVKTVDTSKGLEVLQQGHHHTSGNPHVWLNPLNAIHQVKQICSALVELDSVNVDYYNKNAETYITELKALDQSIEAAIDTWNHKRFVCFHPAWDYFAHRYGLVQAGVIEKRPGMEPSPTDIAEILTTIQSIHAKALFVEAQFPNRLAQMIAEDSGISVIKLDPLGDSQTIYHYIDLMRYNLAQMEKALRDKDEHE